MVVAMVVTIAACAVWFSKYSERGEYRNFSIYFKQHSLSGLQADSDVTMRGIKVGSVSDWQISEKDIELVKVNVRLKSGTPVKTDTRAVINRNLLTGLANVDLTGSSQGAPYLLQVPPNEDFPVIPEGTNGLEAIKNSLPELLQNTNLLVERASRFFSDENQNAVTEIIANLRSISDRLAKGEEHFVAALEKFQKITGDIQRVTSTLSSKIDSISQIFESSMQNIAAETGAASKKFGGTMEKFDDPAELIFGPNKEALGPGEEDVAR